MSQRFGKARGRAWWSAGVLVLMLVAASVSRAAEPAAVVVYAYHLKPPFIVDAQHEQGLYYDFSAYINRKLGKPLLRTEYMPRKRLDQLVQSTDFNGIVIGVNPLWFHDVEERQFLWTSTLMKDRDELVSPADRPINYNGPESLAGKTIGLVNGLYYYGIDEAAAAGQLLREDTNSELQNLTKLRVHRIDATVISRSTFNYLIKHFGGRELYYLSERPHDVFARRILVPFRRRDVYDWLEPQMQKLATDPEWRKIVASYQ